MSSEAEVRDRAKRLYQFIHELIMLRRLPIRSYKSYEQAVPLDELPEAPDCRFIARNDFDEPDQETWLEVRCPKLENYPEPPASLIDWLDPSQLSDATLDMPSLLSGSLVGVELEEFDDEETTISASEVEPPQEIKNAWEQYVENLWWPWAERIRPKYRAKKLYDDLFRMYQKQEHLGETYETVVGFGFLSWCISDAVEIQRHLVTVQLSVELDSRCQILSLRPTASGIEPQLEDDMLDPTQRPPSRVRDHVIEQLSKIDTLWGSDQLHDLLKEYAQALSADALYDHSNVMPKSSFITPVMVFAPCLILRKRGNEGLIGLLDEIIKYIEDGAEIPPAVLQQILITQKHKNEHNSSSEDSFSEDEEIYFPLPANREQRKIIEHISIANGIVVEGPPGTGKSQTIANVICHLLAIGKRVLVTSHTARALQVLQKKLPPQIQPLCVNALSNDAKGMQALEFSVQGITDRHLTWNPEDSESEIIRLEKDLANARERLQLALHDQRSIREAEVFIHNTIAGSYSGTLAEIARQLKNEKENIGLIKDMVQETTIPPCTVEEFKSVLSVLNSNSTINAQDCELPDLSVLYTPSELEFLFSRLTSFETEVARYKAYAHKELYDKLRKVSPEIRLELSARIKSFANRMESLRKQRIEVWIEQAISDIFTDKDRSWKGRLLDSQEILNKLQNLPKETFSIRINGHERHDPDSLRHEAHTLLDHILGRKSKDIGIRYFLSRQVKSALSILENIRINGEPCTNPDTLRQLMNWTDAKCLLESLDKEWASVEDFNEEGFKRRIERYEDVCEPLIELLDLYNITRNLSGELNSACGDLGPAWHHQEDIDTYLNTFSYADAMERLEGSQRKIHEHTRLVQDIVYKTPDFLDRNDIESAITARDTSAYRQAYDALQAFCDEQKRCRAANITLKSLTQVCPILVQELQENAADSKWQALTEFWDAAWSWAAARTWLQNLVAPEAGQRAADRVAGEQDNIQSLLAQLASVKAWAHCFDRLTEEQRVHLQAWSLAMRRVGKGTGKYANQHRREARANIEYCQPAIPAWIMPIYRVADSVRPGQARFDVAIIDEASQSGPEALALLFLANRIIVVGDDKQISPDPFTRTEDANRLRRELVYDIPANDALAPQNSFFDLAKIRYPTRIRLVEHFRCMPEIIQFSNDLCYKSEPLIPLRQFGAGRLEPVVNAVHVPTGFTRGKTQKVNQPEATAIARKIAELLKDKQYEGKSFGVISLLGQKQAKRIDMELLSLVDKRELHARSLICGDAYDFQGDERDIMFLSLVSAPGSDSRIGALAKASDYRRFNVAMSRAKDQVWLFHSATLNDLSHSDVRFQLLKYCQNPNRKQETVSGVNLDELSRHARNANRVKDKAPRPFDSWFEVDVFLKIADEGYLLVPQYELNGYFIDMVVVGQKGRLAVECDGDNWHGAEQWEKDASRQRDLERCGLPFFRIRESVFYLDPESVLQQLLEELKRQVIRPLGDADRSVEKEQTEHESMSNTYEPSEEINLFSGLASDESGEFKTQDQTIPIYEEWEPVIVPDPRRASRDSVVNALLEIATIEGPATWRRIFDRYRIGLGLARLKGPTRLALEIAARYADESEKLLVWPEIDSGDWYDYVVHIPGSERVRVRQRGPRELKDVPCSEIAELIRLRDLTGIDEEWQFRQILSIYGLRRLTKDTISHLRLAKRITQCEL